ncbi:2719_t:CDS:2, partial [Paraglomus occultum]
MLKIRFEELEKKNKTDTVKLTAENAELKERVTKLEQKQTTISSEIKDELRGSLPIPSPIGDQSEEEKNIIPDSIPELEHNLMKPESLAESEIFESSLSQDTINDDSVEILEFVEKIHKENVSNEIRKRNRKKKLQIQGSVQSTSSSSDMQNEVNPVIDTHEHKTTKLESISTDQAQNTGIKIPYNKRIEQNLRHDLSVFIKENNNKVSEAFDIQIPEFSLEVIVTGSSKITAQNIADLFIIAMKIRQKEILCWYCYYKAYENRVENIKCINKIDDQSARTLVYNEIKALLPDISDVNLRQRTFRAKKIHTLLMGIGMEKIQAIACSASAISSLTDNQIQDIINCFPKNSSADVSSAKRQKMISVTNRNAHETEQTLLKATTPSISLSHTSNSIDNISEKLESLPGTESEFDASDSNSESFDNDSLREDAIASEDNESNDEFSDDNEDNGGYCDFSDDDEGYYYDLNT